MKKIKEKVCNICNVEKNIVLFYVNKGMKDGYQNRCIECTKLKSKERLATLISTPEGKEKERARHRDKYHRLGYKDLHRPSTEKKRETIRRNRQKFPEKYMASKYTEIFFIKKKGLNLHHWSYNQKDWLDIIELTIKDHHYLHRYIQYDQALMVYRTLEGVLLDSKEKHLRYFEECKKKAEYSS